MNTAQNPDLHCHSTVSDGTLTPPELAARAHANGVDLWALTDHDELGGQQSALAAAQALGLRYLTGVEISVTFGEQTVHIVGLGFDTGNSALVEGLAHTCNGRTARALIMAERLESFGVKNAYEGALKYAGNVNLIGRAHFARFMVETGFCKDMSEVFRKYLADGRPANVTHKWAALGDAVKWITGAGGCAIVAHPARYRFTAEQESELFNEFIALGGVGLEVVTGSHSAAEAQRYAQVARQFKLAASRGSDFHGPSESTSDLGKLAPLPADLLPIWSILADHVV